MIGIAAVFGAVSIFVANFWISSAANARVAEMAAAKPVIPEQQFGTIVVAKEPLRFGTALDGAQLAEIPWPKDALPDGASPTVKELLAEGPRTVLSPIAANEPILFAKLSGPNGRATLSNLLSPGMRAVSIKIDEVSGVGGFVMPGDRVDVVMTRNAGAIQEVSKNAQGAAGSTLATEVVVENAKVLSVGQGADISQTTPQVADSVTIEVSTDEAQKIALARSVGTLSLALRASVDQTALTSGVTTLSSFGGSALASVKEAATAVVSSADAEPKFKTVVVTRGTEAQTYKVVAPEQPQ